MAASTLIGLDIGSTSIRAIEATRSKDRPVIQNFGQAMLPEGAVVGGVVKDEQAVAHALRTLWTSQTFPDEERRPRCHPPAGDRPRGRGVEPPEKEMKQALPFQVRDALALPLDQALIDFYPLERPGQERDGPRPADRGSQGCRY